MDSIDSIDHSAPRKDFQAAVLTCMAKSINFKGRASRSEYWWFYLFTLLCQIAAFALGTMAGDMLVGFGLSLIVYLALLLPLLAAGARRLHDIDFSGWFLLLLAPIYYAFLATASLFFAVGGLMLMVVLIFLLARPPNPAKNKYDTGTVD